MPKNSDEMKVAELESDLKEAISHTEKAQKLLKKVLNSVEKINLMRNQR